MILVTGGLGYIGSHTVVELLENGYDVVIIDNLSNSKIETLDKLKKITGKSIKYYQNDVCDKEILRKIKLMQLFILQVIKLLVKVFLNHLNIIAIILIQHCLF